MIDLLGMIWKFLLVQPLDHYLRLVPWHLLALLILLGVLSGFGLHFLIGYVFGMYRRKERMAWWLSYPSLIVNLALMQGLLGGYLLVTQAETLVRMNLSEAMSGRMGALLLEPAFAHPLLAGAEGQAVDKSAIQTALANLPEAEYRERLQSFMTDAVPVQQGGGNEADASSAGEEQTGSLTENRTKNRTKNRAENRSDSRGGNRGGLSAEAILLQVGLQWVTSPRQTWLSPLNPGSGGGEEDRKAGDESFFLPDFLASLINELPPEASLPRADWEYVAGTRFVEGILQPLMVEYLNYLILALIALLALLAAIYLYLLRKVGRIGARPPADEAVEPVGAMESAALPSADQEALPETSPPEEPPPTAAGEPPPRKPRRSLFRRSKRKKAEEEAAKTAPAKTEAAGKEEGGVKGEPSPDPAAESEPNPKAAEGKPA